MWNRIWLFVRLAAAGAYVIAFDPQDSFPL